MKMKLSHFAYELPKELIAQEPTLHRDDSRLMVVHKDTGEIEHKHFHQLVDYFDDGDVMVLNNTKVFLPECGVTRRRLVRVLRCSCFVN